MFHRLLGKRHQPAADAGIGPDRIQPPVGGDRFVDEGDDVLFRAGVGDHGFRRAAGLAHLFDGFLDAFGAIDRDQPCSLFGEQKRSRAPNAAAGAGDDDGFAFEAAHECLPA